MKLLIILALSVLILAASSNPINNCNHLENLPIHLQQIVFNSIKDLSVIASLSRVSRHIGKSILETQELFFHQERINILLKKYHGEELLNKMLENVNYLCYRTEPIKLVLVKNDFYLNKIEYLAYLLELKKCNQHPLLIIRDLPNQEFVDSISRSFKIELRYCSFSSKLVFPEGLDKIDMSNCGKNLRFQDVQFPNSLHSLDLSNNGIGSQIEFLQFPSELKVLDMTNNKIGQHIGKLQKLPETLQSLDLSY